MSAPIDDAEVENVLSAIRRLVEDGRTGGAPAPATPGRLVLTPSLRVPGPPAPPAPPVLPAPAPTMGTPRPAMAGPLVLLNALPASAAPGGEATGASPTPDPRPDASASLRPDPSDAAGAEPLRNAAPWPDEATLRALVAEAVRQELRGDLGERLTRNLRKLVRREVMQALTVRDAG